MTKGRLEAFSDGVIAIIITVMLLELKVPTAYSFSSLVHVWPEICSYILSYLMLGIYWNNHHHTFQAVKHISGNVMWANLHLLFWLSLLPFGAEWIRNAGFVGPPVAVFGFILLMSAVAFTMLTTALAKIEGPDSVLARALGKDIKGKSSLAIYFVALAVFYWAPYLSCALYVVVALVWFVPDRRFSHAHLQMEGQE